MTAQNDTAPLVVTEAQLRAVVDLDLPLVEVVESAFAAIDAGRVSMPDVLSLHLPAVNGEMDVKTAAIEGWDIFVVKIGTGFFDNPLRGLPSLMGVVVVLDARTGQTRAILLDNSYLTDLRTAAAGAVAARHLAPLQCSAVGIIGCGTQARLQLKALRLQREFERVIVWGRNAERTQTYAQEMSEALHLPVSVALSPEEVVRECQVVVTTTSARTPLIKREWLHRALHITAVGSDAPYKQELEAGVLHAADFVVCDKLSQAERIGEVHHALSGAPAGWHERIIELGSIVNGRRGSRCDAAQITICDLTGTGAQDTAIAHHTLQRLSGADWNASI